MRTEPVHKCIKCQSKRLVYLRHDGDWGGGNDMTKLNPEKYYKPEDDDLYLDMEYMYCLDCGNKT